MLDLFNIILVLDNSMIALTIDCEQWNSPLLRGRKDVENGNTNYSFEGNKRLLDILKRNKVRATFFVSGAFAEKHPEQLKAIARAHEVASHGYCHFYRNNPQLNIKEDISKSKRIIEKIIGKKIYGFRSPQMQYSEKLLSILGKLKFVYDSSLHSANIPGFYNNKKLPNVPFMMGKVLEIPASASYNLRLPISWAILRNMPLFYSVGIVKKLISRGITPVIYVHSWEFYNLKSKNVPRYVIRNTGEKFCKKLEKFIIAFKREKFIGMRELVDNFSN